MSMYGHHIVICDLDKPGQVIYHRKNKERRDTMKASFYDVKTKQKVEADVTGKEEYNVKGTTRYALKGKTSDGRNLTKFVNKADYDKANV